MSETEPSKRPVPDEGSGEEGEDYGAKAADDRGEPEEEPEDAQVPEAD